MRKVLLVEDENLIRRGLLYKVDWSQVNCAIAGEAATGEEGLERSVPFIRISSLPTSGCRIWTAWKCSAWDGRSADSPP